MSAHEGGAFNVVLALVFAVFALQSARDWGKRVAATDQATPAGRRPEQAAAGAVPLARPWP